jgi:hypothetical protein
MKNPFSRDSHDQRVEYLRGHRPISGRATAKPASLPHVMPPLKVTSLEEDRRNNGRSNGLFNQQLHAATATRTPMMNLVYPPLREADLRVNNLPESKHRREVPQPIAGISRLVNKVFSNRKHVDTQKATEQTQAAAMPRTMYINPRLVIHQPEIRKRSLRGLQLGWRLLSLALAAALSYGIYFMWTSPYFKVTTPSVTGNVRVESAEFISTMAVEGKPAFMIVPSEVKTTLLNTFPELVSLKLEFIFPNKVSLEVMEREPVLIWKQGGQTVWIDLFGIPMMPRGQAGDWFVVTAEGGAVGPVAVDPVNHPGEYKPVVGTDLILTILNLGNMTPSGTTIAYDPRYGLGWVDPKGWKVYFGFNTTGLDSKLAQYAGIVANLDRQGIQPKIISVQYPYAPFYRLEQ